jgi:hypothetical protein
MELSCDVLQKKGKSWLAATKIDKDSHRRNWLIANRDGDLGCSGRLAVGWRCFGEVVVELRQPPGEDPGDGNWVVGSDCVAPPSREDPPPRHSQLPHLESACISSGCHTSTDPEEHQHQM